MKYLRFRNRDGKKMYGILEGNEIHEITDAPYNTYEKTGERYELGSVKLAAPSDPRVIMCAGTNYMDHIRAVSYTHLDVYKRQVFALTYVPLMTKLFKIIFGGSEEE